VARWTEAEHQLALLDRDLRWLEGADPSVAERVKGEWRATLAELAAASADPEEQKVLAEARARLAAMTRPPGR
jgi:hypothetical protein